MNVSHAEPADPRSARSQAALIAAAIALVDERDVAHISVSDLARRADVTRPTLYQHFADRDALLQAAGLARFEGAMAHYLASNSGSLEGVAEALFKHLAVHAIFYRRVLGGSCGPQTHRGIETFIADVIGESDTMGAFIDPQEPLFLAGGAMALVTRWLQEEPVRIESASEAARRAVLLVRNRGTTRRISRE